MNETLPERVEAINKTRSSASVQEAIREYVDEVLPYCLLNLQYYGSYRTTDIIPIYNWNGENEEKYIVVVADTNKMIGTLCVEYTGNDIISVFREENVAELFLSVTNNTPFQLGYSNNCFMIYTNNEFTVIDNPEYVDTSFITNIIVSNSANNSYSFIKNISSALQTRFNTYQASPIKNIANADDPNPDGEGLCWAACVACLGMHRNTNATYTAISIYNLCNSSTNPNRPSGLPIGKTSWIRFALQYIVGIPNTQSSALNSTQIASLLSSNKPIIVFVKPSASDNVGHDLVLYYFAETGSTSGQYVFMDPGANASTVGRVVVTVNSSVMSNGTNLTFTARSGQTYTYWKNSYYPN